jgi:RluA family pseudouridine synthase
VNGRVERRPSRRVTDSDSLRLVRALPVAPTEGPRILGAGPRVLYRDASLLAIDKPAGIATHPTADPSRPSAVAWIREALQIPQVYVQQRLDAAVSGVLLVALDESAARRVTRELTERRVMKEYLAVVAITPEFAASFRRRALRPGSAFTVDWPIAVLKNGRVVCGPDIVAGDSRKTALTRFACLSLSRHGRPTALLKVEIATGRKHQIRVHAAAVGLPILGDPIYGRRGDLREGISRLMLHASALTLAHPSGPTAKMLRVEAPPPEAFESFTASCPASQTDARH